MDKLSSPKRRILDYTKYEMLSKALKAFGDLGDDEELGPVDWLTVKRYIKSLKDVEGERVHPHNVSENDNNLDSMNLKDIRIRLLNGVQAAYWEMLDEGRITQTTANILMQSVDEAIDLVSHGPLCDWKGLKAYAHFPNYYKFLQTSICPQKLVTYFTVKRLESSCYICAAFLRAHRIAQRQLHDFIGDSDIAANVIKESEAEGQEARKFLEDVRATFPQVLHSVKTKQVTYCVLNQLIDYVKNLEKIGLLEEKEMIHLHDAVQADLKRLLRNPTLEKIPSSVHHFLVDLPSSVREPLAGSIKEIMKLRGVTLYKEGAKPDGIWLISNGVVKWTSDSIRNKHSLHPTFTHGSTLGLYEVLIGKPYVCNMITDSMVLCFFIEAEKIRTVLKSDPAAEDIFWQESAIILAKLLLPQIFEKMPMQDLRTLVAERSIMSIHIRGETIEIPQHSIGFLLEGFAKTQVIQEALITSPAALLPSYEDLSFLGSETSGARLASFSYQASWYHFESRARVIIFDIAAFEANRAVQRRSSSLVSHPVDLSSRSLSREHGGLMSWPEHFYNPRQQSNMSARALQLSNFERKVNKAQLPAKIFLASNQAKPSHSLSYPTVPSTPGKVLVSVRSEGSTTVRNNLEFEKVTEQNPAHQLQSSNTQESPVIGNSSDESGAEEDELIVRIDSPSRLSFRQAF